MLGPEVLQLFPVQLAGEPRAQQLVGEKLSPRSQAMILSQTRLSAGRQGSGSWPSRVNSGGSSSVWVSR